MQEKGDGAEVQGDFDDTQFLRKLDFLNNFVIFKKEMCRNLP